MAPIYTMRSDDEIDAALDALGAKPGNRSRIIKEAILEYAARMRADADSIESRLAAVEAAIKLLQERS